MLQFACERPTLRLYGWDQPCLSIGYFQPRQACPELPGRAIIRRVTGGGAIRHGDDVTYAVAGPVKAFGSGPRDAYRAIHRAIQIGLRQLGVAVHERGRGRDEGPGGPLMCFSRKGCYDLVVEGRKLVGSAQRRSGAVFLQHGSIPLRPAESLPLSLDEALGRKAAAEEVFAALEHGFGEVFGPLRPRPFDDDEQRLVESLVATRYTTSGWNWRR